MSMYEQFLQAGLKNQFQSGVRNLPASPLAKAFKGKKKPDASPERMERLKAMLAESKTGQQTLDFLKEKGADLVFEKMPYYGYFSPEDNRVALSPSFSDEDLAVTFVHEVRHAWQDDQMNTWDPNVTPKSFLLTGFAIEADACAAEILYAHEMREKNPKIWEAHQKSGYAPMSTQFEKTFKETGDVAQARADALLKWYDLPRIKNSYGDTYVDYLSEVARDTMGKGNKNKTPECFVENVEPSVIATKLLKDYDGKAFMTDAGALQAPENLSLSEKQALKLARALEPYMTKYRKGADQLGLDKIGVKKPDGGKTTCKAVLQHVRNQKNNIKGVHKGSKSSGR